MRENCTYGSMRGRAYPGLKDCRVLEYDTEQQVAGNHLLYAWETLVSPTFHVRMKNPRISWGFA